jgi:hypothetical protein
VVGLDVFSFAQNIWCNFTSCLLYREPPNGLRPALPALKALFRVRFSQGTCVWAGVDTAWEQKKLKDSLSCLHLAAGTGGRTVQGKMSENAARREAAVPQVRCTLCYPPLFFFNITMLHQQ